MSDAAKPYVAQFKYQDGPKRFARLKEMVKWVRKGFNDQLKWATTYNQGSVQPLADALDELQRIEASGMEPNSHHRIQFEADDHTGVQIDLTLMRE